MAVGTNTIAGHRLRIDMSEKIAELEPNASPLITLTKKMKRRRVVTNPEFSWMEQDPGNRWDAINNAAGYDKNATVWAVDNAGYFRVGDIVQVPSTTEVVLVKNVDNTGNTITVIRGWGGSTTARLENDDPIVILGNANEEGAKLREIKTTEPVKKTNYTQILRTPVGVTNTLAATSTYGPKAMAYYRHLDGINHAIDMERTMWLGKKGKDIHNGKPRRTTGGILEFLTENVLNVSASSGGSGGLTEQAFTEWLEDVFRYGSSEKILFACGRLCTIIDLWAQNKLKTVPGERTYGVKIKEYVSSHGTLFIVKHKLFEGPVYGGMGVILDMNNVAYCPLKGRDTKLLTGRQDPDEDAVKDEYITELGVEVRLPKTHAIIKGVA